jgi:hypothetical protein
VIEAFVVDEEECAIAAQWTTQAAAPLRLREFWPARREETLRVEPIVACEDERRTVQRVRPGLGDDVDDAAGGAADF